MTRTHKLLVAAGFLLSSLSWSREKPGQHSLAEYLKRVQQPTAAAPPAAPGSLWTDNGRLAELATDYKARRVGDLVQILIVQDTVAESSGNVASDRSFKTSSGIQGLAGHVSTSGIQDLFSARSATSLQGKAQATSKSRLRTTLTGRVVAVLPSGVLVLEAARDVTMNNERQSVLLRGLARPGDITSENSVLSTALSDLEVELKGRGVVSEGTRPPNVLVRLLLRLIGF